MNYLPPNYARGSEWRQWDLHVHSPASYFWTGQKFSDSLDQAQDKALVDEMISAMNAAEPSVFALMDYWTFDGWFALQKRLKDPSAPKLTKTVFPGIELRVAAPTKVRLNLHAIFSDQISDQDLNDFRSRLIVALVNAPLSKDALRKYARQAGADKLAKHGHKKSDVEANDAEALAAGYKIAELTIESYQEALDKVPNGHALGFVPFTTNDGLTSVDWNEHYAFAMSLFRTAPIFEAREDRYWNAFVGTKTPENEKWIDNFQAALGNKRRLPVSGSDSHAFVGVKGDNNKRGYGDYPSGRITWIKADPTWLGLQQAIREPDKRCFIGEQPPKMKVVKENKTFYLKSVRITKVPGSTLPSQWFDGSDIPLNPDLIAIIGNKGSGKSALADVMALVGNSRDKEHFSFLCRKRFRGVSGDPAKQFVGQLNWLAGDSNECNLGDNPPAEGAELIRYIPQGRFEDLCNDHVSGKSGAFERELRTVVFDHLPADHRLDALTFEELLEEQEKAFRAQLNDARLRLSEINRTIATLERDLHPTIKAQVIELLKLKNRELQELNEVKPAEVTKPSEQPTANQEAAAAKISAAALELEKLAERTKVREDQQRQNAVRKRAIRAAQDQLALFKSQADTFERNLSVELAKIGVAYGDVVQLTISTEKIVSAQLAVTEVETAAAQEAEDIAAGTLLQQEHIKQATQELNGPQQVYQAYQVGLAAWQERVKELEGAANIPDSKLGLEARIAAIALMPEQLALQRAERETVARQIFKILVSQRTAREQLFEPLQVNIRANPLIGTDYDLQFKANLQTFTDLVADPLFSIVKQNVGQLRGEDESKHAIQTRLDASNMNEEGGAIEFAASVHDLLHDSARQLRKEGADVAPLLRKERKAEEAYDFIFGFEYLTPHYTLLFQDTPIEQLSPGQRGALLLIFYLLVDKGRNPIILDQPEENLDNETVVNLLVPVLGLAKETRQIFMVTHNPNLAVVCDAEQIIMCTLDRKDGEKISYDTGSIENPRLNASVVKVLEGTKPAFDNRGAKYH